MMPRCMLMLISALDDIKTKKWWQWIVIANEINDFRDAYLLLCACYR